LCGPFKGKPFESDHLFRLFLDSTFRWKKPENAYYRLPFAIRALSLAHNRLSVPLPVAFGSVKGKPIIKKESPPPSARKTRGWEAETPEML